jgi:hypothetical protein
LTYHYIMIAVERPLFNSKSERIGSTWGCAIGFEEEGHLDGMWVTAAQILDGTALPEGVTGNIDNVVAGSIDYDFDGDAAAAIAEELRDRGGPNVTDRARSVGGVKAFQALTSTVANAVVKYLQKRSAARKGDGSYSYSPEVVLLFTPMVDKLAVHTDLAIDWGDESVTVFSTGRHPDGAAGLLASMSDMSQSSFQRFLKDNDMAKVDVDCSANGAEQAWAFAGGVVAGMAFWKTVLNSSKFEWCSTFDRTNQWIGLTYVGTCGTMSGNIIRGANCSVNCEDYNWVDEVSVNGKPVRGFTGGLCVELRRPR